MRDFLKGEKHEANLGALAGTVHSHTKPAGVSSVISQREQRRENFILYGEKNFVIMNLFPYNPGHL
jgi:hypothetical protein